jgi:hypothetical protein
MAKAKKITVTPVLGLADVFIDGERFPSDHLPFEVGAGVFLADVHQQVKNADHSLWAQRYLSKEDVEELKNWHYVPNNI